jgi:hypothetical protein
MPRIAAIPGRENRAGRPSGARDELEWPFCGMSTRRRKAPWARWCAPRHRIRRRRSTSMRRPARYGGADGRPGRRAGQRRGPRSARHLEAATSPLPASARSPSSTPARPVLAAGVHGARYRSGDACPP